jgi:ApaG protein
MTVQQITQGIKVSAVSEYRGNFVKNNEIQYAYTYTIEIENQSEDKVQLLSRFWEIRDSLNDTTIVKGKGVIGLQPTLLPGEKHTYSSGCLLTSTVGSMTGHYILLNHDTQEEFKVNIPVFQLFTEFIMN